MPRRRARASGVGGDDPGRGGRGSRSGRSGRGGIGRGSPGRGRRGRGRGRRGRGQSQGPAGVPTLQMTEDNRRTSRQSTGAAEAIDSDNDDDIFVANVTAPGAATGRNRTRGRRGSQRPIRRGQSGDIEGKGQFS